jgi:hypothetical protein
MTRTTPFRFSLGLASAALLLAGCAGSMPQGSGMTDAELDALTQKIVRESFRD